MSRRLGEILVGAQVLAEGSLAEALARQRGTGKRLGTVLVEMGLLDEQTIAAALGAQLGLPVADVRHGRADDDAVDRLPEAVARTALAVPLRFTADGLEVAVADPLDESVRSQLERAAGLPIVLRVAPSSDVRGAIDRTYALRRRHRRPSPAPNAEPADAAPAVTDPDPGHDPLAALLGDAVRAGAWAVDLEPEGPEHAVVHVRTDAGPAPSAARVPAGILAPLRRAGRGGEPFRLLVDGEAVEVSVATMPTAAGERAHLRLTAGADRWARAPTLDDLGMGPEVAAAVRAWLHGADGLLLVAGPRRSGRTATLAAAAGELAQAGRRVLVVRGPQPAGAWARMPSQEPDAVVADAVADTESAQGVTTLALQGVTVMAAVLAPDALRAAATLVALGVQPTVAAASVSAVLVQRPEGQAEGSPFTYAFSLCTGAVPTGSSSSTTTRA